MNTDGSDNVTPEQFRRLAQTTAEEMARVVAAGGHLRPDARMDANGTWHVTLNIPIPGASGEMLPLHGYHPDLTTALRGAILLADGLLSERWFLNAFPAYDLTRLRAFEASGRAVVLGLSSIMGTPSFSFAMLTDDSVVVARSARTPIESFRLALRDAEERSRPRFPGTTH